MANILIMEDDFQHLDLLVEILKFAGHKPFPAQNTGIAQKVLDENQIDFIITDITLPGMSGLDFMEELQKSGKKIPFVVLTGSLDPSDEERAKKLNVKAYFVKPVDPEKLLNSLK
ncbi:MAG: response regulator [Calditrichaceae bacterium]